MLPQVVLREEEYEKDDEIKKSHDGEVEKVENKQVDSKTEEQKEVIKKKDREQKAKRKEAITGEDKGSC